MRIIKLLFCIDSSVVEALKSYKVAKEIGFPGIPTIWKSEGEGGCLLERGNWDCFSDWSLPLFSWP